MKKIILCILILFALVGTAFALYEQNPISHLNGNLGSSVKSWLYAYVKYFRVVAGGNLVFEGATDDSYETTISVTDATADRTITIPDTTGTLVLNNGAELQTPQISSGVATWVSGETLLSATTISLGADGNTTIFTVPSGKRAVITKAVFVAAADVGASTLTIGQAGVLTDFLGTQTLSNINAQYDVAILQPVPNATTVLSKSYAAGTVIKAVVGSHAGAAGNTLYLFGFAY